MTQAARLIIFPAPNGNGVAFAGAVPVRLEWPDASEADCKAIAHVGPGIAARHLKRAHYATASEAIDVATRYMPRERITVLEH